MAVKKQNRKKPARSPKVERKEKKGPYGMGCLNRECKLRQKGCTGFEGCPGYKGR